MIPPEKKIERMVNVARLYYEQNMTQNEIAKELGISRPLVSILLTEARACGVVTITIKRVEDLCALAADGFCEREKEYCSWPDHAKTQILLFLFVWSGFFLLYFTFSQNLLRVGTGKHSILTI